MNAVARLFLAGVACLAVLGASANAALVGFYKFDEGSGTVAIDTAGGDGLLPNPSEPSDDDDGSIVGATYVPGIAPLGTPGFGTNALSFNGTSHVVNLGTSQDMLTNVSGATMAAWIQASSFSTTGQNSIVGVSVGPGGAATAARFVLQIARQGTVNVLRAGGRDNDTAAFTNLIAPTNTALSPNTLYHVAATINYATNSFELFLNGTSIATGVTGTNNLTAATTSPNTASQTAFIGASASGNTEYFAGIIDDVRIYNTILTASEINALAVPEPSTMMLALVGGAALLGLSRRKVKRLSDEI
jgi:hypothetical protein